MIVKMRHLDLICVASEKAATLEKLRALGVVHLDLGASVGAAVVEAKGAAADAEKAVRLIQKSRGKAPKGTAECIPEQVLELDRNREALKGERDKLEREIKSLEPYGDFDPELAAKLREKVEGLDKVVTLPEKLPEARLSKLQERAAQIDFALADMEATLAGCDEGYILKSYPELADKIAFEQAKELLADHGALAVISGWVPETVKLPTDCGWGVYLRDAAEGEIPPTLIEPPKAFKAMKSLFAGLGIAPAYTEADVSVPFMCYFSLFFAMLVGDGAYGAIFLLGTLAARKVLPKSWLILLSVFSGSTILWGILSNTWFGAAIPFLSGLPTVAWLADPSYNNMMLLCFTIGVSHLMLARIWNGICRLPDTTAIAEFGWAGILLMMYLVTNSIVGIFPAFPSWGLYMGAISILAVFLFTVKPSELKTRGAELGMLPLNIMSALGDIISYVRLFAVGLASVKVAENFNNMAIDLVKGDGDWWVKALMSVAMVAILVFGHVLNLAMAGLSILVHAVRLNTLEFSNHKGITWSGYAFRAFARSAK